MPGPFLLLLSDTACRVPTMLLLPLTRNFPFSVFPFPFVPPLKSETAVNPESFVSLPGFTSSIAPSPLSSVFLRTDLPILHSSRI